MEREQGFQLVKALNNNALVAVDDKQREVILLGKGIGFQKTKGQTIPLDDRIEKVFVLTGEENREQMVRVFLETDEEVIRAVNEYIQYVEDHLQKKLTEPVMVAIIDHLSFAIRRIRQGYEIQNPFLDEVRSLYQEEYSLAQEGIWMLERRLNIRIPDDEIGFLTLHLHTARTNQSLSKLNRFSTLIAKLIEVIEQQLNIKIDKASIDYARLLTHLRFAIERSEKGQPLNENHPLSELLQREYPLCYNSAWKLVRIMQNELKVKIPEAEASYLTLHIQRIMSHIQPT